MSKHINFLGYSLWVQDHAEQISAKILSKAPLYSPRALAAYCIFFDFGIGTLLYSINVFRRGYLWRGRAIAILSVVLLVVEMFTSASGIRFLAPGRSILNMLVAICLYSAEKPHFNRAVRDGMKQARWWLPLVWILAVVLILLLLRFVL
ncbi:MULTISPECIES: hypothetical protein [Trichocoleus]|uniref:Uncharacterized protein n=1 Tax=Trichocoleus desertorum GB2-A4 TaxID=2933944 RepID=A0ABV0JD41_9CYAN|nr:hypothetical protein [Trichocoleus sp. FACHB-46]MBD1864345.1 hypothetical protein [Trichocoleus sp. FACHB-46]